MTACGTVPLAQPEGDATVTVASPTLTSTSTPTATLDNPQTIFFTVQSDQGPEIYRMQVDDQGEQTGTVERVDFPTTPTTLIAKLFPSPNNQYVAVTWVHGEAAHGSITILDIATGQTLVSLSNKLNQNLQANFLAWTPDSQSVLVMGASGSDLTGSAWLVDVSSGDYQAVDIKQRFGAPTITSAIFSPDGRLIIYAQSGCFQCGHQLWQLAVDGSHRQQLSGHSKAIIEDMVLSPDGEYIAFLQWVEGYQYGDIGKLWLMKADGSEPHLLSEAMVDYYDHFKPIWSFDNQTVLFIQNDDSGHNIYAIDVSSEQVTQLTDFEDTRVSNLTWSPDGNRIAFIINDGTDFSTWTIDKEGDDLQRLSVTTAMAEINSRRTSEEAVRFDKLSFFMWLP